MTLSATMMLVCNDAILKPELVCNETSIVVCRGGLYKLSSLNEMSDNNYFKPWSDVQTAHLCTVDCFNVFWLIL